MRLADGGGMGDKSTTIARLVVAVLVMLVVGCQKSLPVAPSDLS
jgi:hypothetical protein